MKNAKKVKVRVIIILLQKYQLMTKKKNILLMIPLIIMILAWLTTYPLIQLIGMKFEVILRCLKTARETDYKVMIIMNILCQRVNLNGNQLHLIIITMSQKWRKKKSIRIRSKSIKLKNYREVNGKKIWIKSLVRHRSAMAINRRAIWRHSGNHNLISPAWKVRRGSTKKLCDSWRQISGSIFA